MAFEAINNPETITAICTGIATVLGAIAVFLKKVKGKTWKEIFSSVNKEELNIIKDVIKEQNKIIKETIAKEKANNHPKEK